MVFKRQCSAKKSRRIWACSSGAIMAGGSHSAQLADVSEVAEAAEPVAAAGRPRAAARRGRS